ncbi:phosphatidylinositol n-acetylglucosaminyltransferase [Pyrrhoderma noxium]|uniref:Phosphatidylinositol n-acetylglucosaminyltransferase n=1 Tax=Pyrrhoderma noxium TaxID=2282107 RepID=A0A286UVR0_9AGAM|nr:phosphatidylinositol n-acetylglucosaminyltransferase [Pyrrhoderma noxium]
MYEDKKMSRHNNKDNVVMVDVEKKGINKPRNHLDIISGVGYNEYRVYSRNISKRRLTGNETSLQLQSLWLDASLAVLLASFVYRLESFTEGEVNYRNFLLFSVPLCIYVYWRCTQIVYESVIVSPTHGVQIETHKGPYPSCIFFSSRRFIPSVYIQDIIINEALHRWNVRFYLAILSTTVDDKHELVVIFKNILPHFPIVLEVYRGMMQTMYTQDRKDKNL